MENLDPKDLKLKPISIYLIDDEPIFCAGFAAILQSFPQFTLIDFDSTIPILEQIKINQPGLIILEFQFLSLAKIIIREYPDIPIVLLTGIIEQEEIRAVSTLGIRGYAPKNIPIEELIFILLKIANGETYWYQSNKKSLNKKYSQTWLSKLRKSGLTEINHSLALIDNNLKNPQSLFDRFFWQGRKRELLVAKWLVKQLLPVEVIIVNEQKDKVADVSGELVLTANYDSLLLYDDRLNNLLIEIRAKITSDLVNNSNYVLEVDILTDLKKQELLQIIFDHLINKINQIQVKINEKNITEQYQILLRDIWQEVTINFFTKNYEQNIDLTQYQIIEIIKKELPPNFQTIINYQDVFIQILRYIILQENIKIGTRIYDYNSSEALEVMRILMETLIIMIANATMEVILNNFGEESVIQENLYQAKMMSLREIARFRNSLSFRYFRQKYIEYPRQIFEGEYEFFQIINNQIVIYIFKQINRKKELNELTGFGWFVTIILEFRDAMSPVVRSFIARVGNGLIFILTQVIGRGIGLIGRGIVEGLGNSLPRQKANKKNNNNY